MHTPRRGFLNTILSSSFAATAAAVLYPIWRFILPPETAESAELSATVERAAEMPPNSGQIFRFGQRPGLLVHTPEGEWRAFSAMCTHLNCTVDYDPGARMIICACHNGVFDLSGRNISGPPPRPLESYSVNLRNEDVVVSKV